MKKGRRVGISGFDRRSGMKIILGVAALLTAVLLFYGMELNQKNQRLLMREEQVMAQLKSEEERTKEIDELKDYMKTDRYVEDVARDKLGLVNDNEIIFKEQK